MALVVATPVQVIGAVRWTAVGLEEGAAAPPEVWGLAALCGLGAVCSSVLAAAVAPSLVRRRTVRDTPAEEVRVHDVPVVEVNEALRSTPGAAGSAVVEAPRRGVAVQGVVPGQRTPATDGRRSRGGVHRAGRR